MITSKTIELETRSNLYKISAIYQGDDLIMPSFQVNGEFDDEHFWDNENYIFGNFYDALTKHLSGDSIIGTPIEDDIKEADIPEEDYSDIVALLDEAINQGFYNRG